MKNKVIIPTILFIAVFIFSLFILIENKENNLADNTQENQKTEESQIILYYGEGCPHCVIVKEYIKQNNIQDKVSFVQKEVYYNKNNAKELETRAKTCGLPTNLIGVPFLWDGEKCLIGDQDIINFFKQKTNEQ